MSNYHNNDREQGTFTRIICSIWCDSGGLCIGGTLGDVEKTAVHCVSANLAAKMSAMWEWNCSLYAT